MIRITAVVVAMLAAGCAAEPVGPGESLGRGGEALAVGGPFRFNDLLGVEHQVAWTGSDGERVRGILDGSDPFALLFEPGSLTLEGPDGQPQVIITLTEPIQISVLSPEGEWIDFTADRTGGDDLFWINSPEEFWGQNPELAVNLIRFIPRIPRIEIPLPQIVITIIHEVRHHATEEVVDHAVAVAINKVLPCHELRTAFQCQQCCDDTVGQLGHYPTIRECYIDCAALP